MLAEIKKLKRHKISALVTAGTHSVVTWPMKTRYLAFMHGVGTMTDAILLFDSWRPMIKEICASPRPGVGEVSQPVG